MYTVLTDYKSSVKATWHAKNQAHRSRAGSLSPTNLLTVSPSPDPFSSKHNRLFISLWSEIFVLPFPSASSLRDYKIYSHKQTLFFMAYEAVYCCLLGVFWRGLDCWDECLGAIYTSWLAGQLQQFPWTKTVHVESTLRAKLQCITSKEYLIVTLSWQYANET